MKIRKGFVSNSSTSSFICEICGQEAGGHSISLSDVGMCLCENEHVMCEHHIKDYDFETYYEFPEKYCPICNFEQYSASDMALYLEKLSGITRAEVLAEIKQKNKRRRKVYDEEYISYVCEKKNLNVDNLLKEFKGKFKSYNEFLESF